MKKSFKVLFLSALMFVLAGCYKVDIDMEIKADGKMDVSVIYALDKNMMDSLGGSEDGSSSIKTSDYKELEEKGFKVEEYTEKTDENNYVGVKITKSYASIDEVVGEGKERVALLSQNDNGIADKDLFTKSGSVYKSNFMVDLDTGDSSLDTSSYDSYLKLSYSVTLPQKSKSNNADETKDGGKTLVWNLKYGKKNNIDFEFELGSSSNLVMIILIAAAVVVVGGAVAYVVMNKNKKTETTTEA